VQTAQIHATKIFGICLDATTIDLVASSRPQALEALVYEAVHGIQISQKPEVFPEEGGT
jgi:hypothetical protein